ncbi:hypothetical protein LOK49_LG02G00743 [Camellia lanceoleosa]|uniref:Uncharacterized protein n=1 Tax=Camellia lanceoleosa TaxID=1840588 RepID=A0ACC0IPM9_9ERIC|nr:hypothetical protein LOK49_LG02G00743 [Camellia lanceoleosa]
MIGRKLKKNSVALDIVNFGEEDEGKAEKLEALLAAVNNNDSSHIVHVPAGPNALFDVLISWSCLSCYLRLSQIILQFSELCSSNNELYFPSQALVRTHMVWKKDKKRIRRSKRHEIAAA